MSVLPQPFEDGAPAPRQERDFRLLRMPAIPGNREDGDDFTNLLPRDLRGISVLEIGDGHAQRTADLERRGAARVLAMKTLSLYGTARLRETFDLVLFDGQLGELQHPLRALDTLREVVGRTLLFRSAGPSGTGSIARAVGERDDDPLMFFVAGRGAGASWWAPNQACVEAMLRSAGFTIEERSAGPIYVCRPA